MFSSPFEILKARAAWKQKIPTRASFIIVFSCPVGIEKEEWFFDEGIYRDSFVSSHYFSNAVSYRIQIYICLEIFTSSYLWILEKIPCHHCKLKDFENLYLWILARIRLWFCPPPTLTLLCCFIAFLHRPLSPPTPLPQPNIWWFAFQCWNQILGLANILSCSPNPQSCTDEPGMSMSVLRLLDIRSCKFPRSA